MSIKITHDEARKETHVRQLKVQAYITQQEEKDEMFKRLFKVCKEYKCTSVGLSDDSEFLNVMGEIEEELK